MGMEEIRQSIEAATAQLAIAAKGFVAVAEQVPAMTPADLAELAKDFIPNDAPTCISEMQKLDKAMSGVRKMIDSLLNVANKQAVYQQCAAANSYAPLVQQLRDDVRAIGPVLGDIGQRLLALGNAVRVMSVEQLKEVHPLFDKENRPMLTDDLDVLGDKFLKLAPAVQQVRDNGNGRADQLQNPEKFN